MISLFDAKKWSQGKLSFNIKLRHLILQEVIYSKYLLPIQRLIHLFSVFTAQFLNDSLDQSYHISLNLVTNIWWVSLLSPVIRPHRCDNGGGGRGCSSPLKPHRSPPATFPSPTSHPKWSVHFTFLRNFRHLPPIHRTELEQIKEASPEKNTFSFGHCPNWGRGAPCPNWF